MYVSCDAFAERDALDAYLVAAEVSVYSTCEWPIYSCVVELYGLMYVTHDAFAERDALEGHHFNIRLRSACTHTRMRTRAYIYIVYVLDACIHEHTHARTQKYMIASGTKKMTHNFYRCVVATHDRTHSTCVCEHTRLSSVCPRH
jgi:hypothetical protein